MAAAHPGWSLPTGCAVRHARLTAARAQAVRLRPLKLQAVPCCRAGTRWHHSATRHPRCTSSPGEHCGQHEGFCKESILCCTHMSCPLIGRCLAPERSFLAALPSASMLCPQWCRTPCAASAAPLSTCHPRRPACRAHILPLGLTPQQFRQLYPGKADGARQDLERPACCLPACSI